MPNRNGTGPVEAGPMTGRGMGYCSGYVVTGQIGLAGRCGMGRGRGRGIRAFTENLAVNQITQNSTAGQQIQNLNEKIEYLEINLKETRERIEELQNSND